MEGASPAQFRRALEVLARWRHRGVEETAKLDTLLLEDVFPPVHRTRDRSGQALAPAFAKLLSNMHVVRLLVECVPLRRESVSSADARDCIGAYCWPLRAGWSRSFSPYLRTTCSPTWREATCARTCAGCPPPTRTLGKTRGKRRCRLAARRASARFVAFRPLCGRITASI